MEDVFRFGGCRMIRVRIDQINNALAQARRVAEARMEPVGEGQWRVTFRDKQGGRWSTTIEHPVPVNPWKVLKQALAKLPEEEECAWCGQVFRVLLQDGICGTCRAMKEGEVHDA